MKMGMPVITLDGAIMYAIAQVSARVTPIETAYSSKAFWALYYAFLEAYGKGEYDRGYREGAMDQYNKDRGY